MTKDIQKALELGKVKGAKALLTNYYKQEDKNKWLADRQAEYDVLFKTALVEIPEELDEDGNVVVEATSYYEYIEDCVSFTDWLNETVVVQEAVEPTYDEEGLVLTEGQPEVTELVRPYVANDVSELVNTYIGSKYAELRKAEYPDIGEQLDMMYKDLINGTTTWKDMINGIKTKYPKN